MVSPKLETKCGLKSSDYEAGIDYEKLRSILEQQYGREVPLSEAIGTGKFLLNVYEILLDNRGENDKI